MECPSAVCETVARKLLVSATAARQSALVSFRQVLDFLPVQLPMSVLNDHHEHH